MKNDYFFLALTIALLVSQFLVSQTLFNNYTMDASGYNKMLKNAPDIDIEFIKEKTYFFNLNQHKLDEIINAKESNLNIQIPFFTKKILDININLFEVNKQDIEIRRNTINGILVEAYSPNIITYRIQENEDNITGIFIFSHKGVKAIFNVDQKTYQIELLNNRDNIYFMSSIQDSPIKFDFMCSNNILNQIPQEIDNNNLRIGNLFGCVNIALEIDYYTMQSFNNYQESIDWAIEMLAAASVFYSQEIGVELTTDFIQTWEIEDPYADFIEEPNDMLFAIRDYWNGQDNLSIVDRDLVHLLSRRSNTGTGGIAFLNGVDSSWNGYGFSSGLTETEEYVDLPVPYFFWNIYCVMHELGHNFGSKHTQWCGWPSGPIDNCVNIEEMLAGECINYIDNPEPEIGTIMSYCHMWPAQSGGGIIMKFHDTVKDAIIAYMGLQNLTDCNENQIFGCVEQDACNYNSEATENDNSCMYPELYYDCNGNCLNDTDSNGICDESQNVSIDIFSNHNGVVLYPNPANEYISIKTDNLSVDSKSLQIINSLGQLVFINDNIHYNEEINISSMSAGRYIAYVITDEKIIKENIIIQ